MFEFWLIVLRRLTKVGFLTFAGDCSASFGYFPPLSLLLLLLLMVIRGLPNAKEFLENE